jgi:hypothetical protein
MKTRSEINAEKTSARLRQLHICRLNAIAEALASRLAGELDDTEIPQSHYVMAMQWVQTQLRKSEIVT